MCEAEPEHGDPLDVIAAELDAHMPGKSHAARRYVADNLLRRLEIAGYVTVPVAVVDRDRLVRQVQVQCAAELREALDQVAGTWPLLRALADRWEADYPCPHDSATGGWCDTCGEPTA
jgi:hypothetical protein